MRDLFRRTKVMSHDVVQPLVLTVIADLSRLVMRRGRRAHGDGIIADGGHGFRDPAAGAPDGPSVLRRACKDRHRAGTGAGRRQ